MTNCYACNDNLKLTEKIICSRKSCAKQFHYFCVNLSADFKKHASNWICPSCNSKKPKADNSNTPVRQHDCILEEDQDYVTKRKMTSSTSSSKSSVDKLPIELHATIQKELVSTVREILLSEFGNIKEQVTNLESSLKFVSAQYDDILKQLKTNSAETKSLKEENANIRQELTKCESRIKLLEQEQVRQQQWARLQNVEIVGIPETKQEQTADIVMKIGEHIGTKVTVTDVEFAPPPTASSLDVPAAPPPPHAPSSPALDYAQLRMHS